MAYISLRLPISTVVVLLLANWVTALRVTIPLTAPSDAQPLSPTLLSFSIEQDNWPDWSGTNSRNEFVHNVLLNYATLTGHPPKLRVGADSADLTFWSPTVSIREAQFPPPTNTTPYPEATHVTVGDGFYQLSRFLPRGTHMTWGVNLGADNVTNTVNMAKSIIKAFSTPSVVESGVVLDLIEIGNEPDVYPLHGVRPSNWTAEQYVADWISVAGPVAEAAGVAGRDGAVSLQGGSLIGLITPRDIFQSGILDSDPGKAISVISQHHYSGAFCDGASFSLVSLMNKTAIRGNLSFHSADIVATHAQGLPFILGETNNVGCHGSPGVSNTAGNALWVIDYTLQAATLGIREAFFHEGIGYTYNFIQPVALNRSIIDGSALDIPLPPHIQPAYYGGLVINSLIGKTGRSHIVELKVDDANISGYAAFEDGELVRAVFINLHPWLMTSTGSRPSIRVDLGFANGHRTREATARRLWIQHADDTANVTWAGQTYETTDGIPAGDVVREAFVPSEGLDLRATEVVMVDF